SSPMRSTVARRPSGSNGASMLIRMAPLPRELVRASPAGDVVQRAFEVLALPAVVVVGPVDHGELLVLVRHRGVHGPRMFGRTGVVGRVLQDEHRHADALGRFDAV